MKTNFISFAFLIVACINLSSCSKDDAEPIPTLDKSSITLYVDETSTLTYSGAECKWSTDNYLIAEVNNGKITAKHVGTTIIHANNLTCTVIVKPRYNTYIEPYQNFGCSKTEVKNKMSAYNIKSDNGTTIVYYGKGKIDQYGYTFENDKLKSSSFYITLDNSVELAEFMLERYWVIETEKTGNNSYYFSFGSVDLKTVAFMQLNSSGAIVMYRSTEDGTN